VVVAVGDGELSIIVVVVVVVEVGVSAGEEGEGATDVGPGATGVHEAGARSEAMPKQLAGVWLHSCSLVGSSSRMMSPSNSRAGHPAQAWPASPAGGQEKAQYLLTIQSCISALHAA
jgi:hypothetical protein